MISKLMNNWADTQTDQAMLINFDLNEYFKFINNEFIVLKDVIFYLKLDFK